MSKPFDLLGSWVNQNGSVLEILEVEEDQLKGVFESKKGRAAKDKSYTVVGCVNGDIVSFVVNFKSEEANLHSITSFSGRLARDQEGIEQIHTLWVLARQFEDSEMSKPTQAWNAFITNSDVFTRILGP